MRKNLESKKSRQATVADEIRVWIDRMREEFRGGTLCGPDSALMIW
tara:strand:+ start:4088 stop:4225 length:138 start_codon:yes stop_codon:yes gene_type:complete